MFCRVRCIFKCISTIVQSLIKFTECTTTRPHSFPSNLRVYITLFSDEFHCMPNLDLNINEVNFIEIIDSWWPFRN